MAMITLGTLAALTAYKQTQDGLGILRFDTSAASKPQSHFIRGLKHLNLCENDDALVQFNKALAYDSNFTMAKIASALSHKAQLGFGVTDKDAGRKALSSINCNTMQTCKISKNEVGYLIAAQAYFDPMFSEEQQLDEYSFIMKSLYIDFPKDPNVGAMYAFSLLSKAAKLEESEDLDTARVVLKNLFETSPKHPGVLLGMVIAFDSPNPSIAQNALKASQKISKIVYKSSIALHAASHIAQTLGNYTAVLAQNQKAYAISLGKCSSRFTPLVKKDYCDEESKYMALEWIHHALMMQCDYTRGFRVLEEFDTILKRNPKHAPFQGWLLRMYARQVFGSKAVIKQISHSTTVGRSSWVPATIEGSNTSEFWDAYSEAGALLARGQDILKIVKPSLDDIQALHLISSRLVNLDSRVKSNDYITKAIKSMLLVHVASTKFYFCKERVCAEKSLLLWNKAVDIEISNKRGRNSPILPFESVMTLYTAFVIENLPFFRHSRDFEVDIPPTVENAFILLNKSISTWGPRTKTILSLHKLSNEDPVRKSNWYFRKSTVFKTLSDYNINQQCLV